MLSKLYSKRILNENSTAGRTDLVQKFSADVSEQKTVNKRFLERSPTYASKTNRDYAQARACDTGVVSRIVQKYDERGNGNRIKNFN